MTAGKLERDSDRRRDRSNRWEKREDKNKQKENENKCRAQKLPEYRSEYRNIHVEYKTGCQFVKQSRCFFLVVSS